MAKTSGGRKAWFLVVMLLMLVLAGNGATTLNPAQVEPTPSATPTLSLTPPPPPTMPAAPDISGTWDVTRSWYRRCPRCSEPVIRGTTWVITQNGHELRVDRGLRGTIEGYNIHLEGIESDGFHRFDFYYSRLYLSPDGLTITGEFVGSERVQNTCGYTPPIVTCFVNGGSLYAVRRSPPPIPPPPIPSPTSTETQTPTLTATLISSPSMTPSATPSMTPSPSVPAAGAATPSYSYLPLVMHPRPTSRSHSASLAGSFGWVHVRHVIHSGAHSPPQTVNNSKGAFGGILDDRIHLPDSFLNGGQESLAAGGRSGPPRLQILREILPGLFTPGGNKLG